MKPIWSEHSPKCGTITVNEWINVCVCVYLSWEVLLSACATLDVTLNENGNVSGSVFV